MRDGLPPLGAAALIAFTTALLPAAAAAPGEPPLPPPRPRDAAAAVPLPPVRPPDHAIGPVFGPPMPSMLTSPHAPPPLPTPSPEPAGAAVPLADELVCLRLFASGKVVARALAPMGGTGGCGVAAPVEVSAVVASPTQRIAVQPPVTIDCALGEAVANWVRDDLVPAFAAAGSPLRAMSSTSGYACRSRNSVPGAKLSEHGRGNAMDIGIFGTADGKTFGVKQAGIPLLASIKATACARFATVLGPGSDGFHESHMHVDLDPRRHGGTICHWEHPGDAAPAARTGPR